MKDLVLSSALVIVVARVCNVVLIGWLVCYCVSEVKIFIKILR